MRLRTIVKIESRDISVFERQRLRNEKAHRKWILREVEAKECVD
jgi:hypothetical protein